MIVRNIDAKAIRDFNPDWIVNNLSVCTGSHSLRSANPLMRLMPDALRLFCSFLTVAQVWLTPLSW